MTNIINNAEKKSMWFESKEFRDKQYLYYSAPVKCDLCEKEFCRGNLTRHNKSRQHLKLLKLKASLIDKVKTNINEKIAILNNAKKTFE